MDLTASPGKIRRDLRGTQSSGKKGDVWIFGAGTLTPNSRLWKTGMGAMAGVSFPWDVVDFRRRQENYREGIGKELGEVFSQAIQAPANPGLSSGKKNYGIPFRGNGCTRGAFDPVDLVATALLGIRRDALSRWLRNLEKKKLHTTKYYSELFGKEIKGCFQRGLRAADGFVAAFHHLR